MPSFLQLLLVAVLLPTYCKCIQPLLVSTPSGPYLGRHLPEFDQDLFFGIRFAHAPRLRNPEPVADTWVQPRDARYPGLACCLDCYQESLDYQNVSVGEDCLNLNIIRPSGTTEISKLPVAVWLYGGGFAAGLGHDTTSNTSYTIRSSVENGTPIITVSLNYRLGFLGFPGGYQAQAAGVTNLGLKDQRMALEWIQKNIAAFGGDPNRVTLWGQSAGAASIGLQILAYGGEGAEKLFRGAIMVSGAPYGSTNMLMPTHPNCVEAYEAIVKATHCDDADDGLQCLRDAPLDTLWEAYRSPHFPTWWPMIDGDFIEKSPAWQMEAGGFSRDITVLAGANSDEGLSMSAWFAAGADTEYELRSILENLFPAARDELIDRILDIYENDDPSPPYSLPMRNSGFCDALEAANMSCGNQFRRFAAIGGDYAQISGRRQMVRQWAEKGGKAYSYRFDTNPTSIPITETGVKPGFGSHSAEYAYFFRFPPEMYLLERNPPVVNVSSHLDLSRGISDQLIAFIATGDPNKAKDTSFPRWPPYSVDNPKNMVWNATEKDNKLNVHIEDDTWRSEGMELWIKYGIELQIGSNWRPW